jgi:uncharacterized protein (TIGR02145 family)
MSKKLTLMAFFATVSLGLFSQRPTLELTFTANENAAYVQLDSIKVMNRTQGVDTVLYWPDTALLIYYVGIKENPAEKNTFQVYQNYPNPVADQTTISLYVPDKDRVSLIVTDMLGRVILQSDQVLDRGAHSFRFTPGGGNLYYFTARWRGNSSSIKILQTGFPSGRISTIIYEGNEDISPPLKSGNAIQSFSFIPGDELLYIGYAAMLQSGMPDAPLESKTCTFQFATNIPCPGTPTVEFGGQVYNTIQIFSQCWLKENLNVGEMILETMGQSNNGAIEKYCYNNDPTYCNLYGGLYQWNEMMQYTTQAAVQGICPPGWHLPTDEEWKVLEAAVDSQYGIGHNLWDSWGYRGFDAGINLKTTSGWYSNGNGTDLFGFSGQPGGNRGFFGGFYDISTNGFWWSSTQGGAGEWGRTLNYLSPEVLRVSNGEDFGFSVRCLRDEIVQ